MAFLLAEGLLRLADGAGHIELWEERRTALNDSIWMKSDYPGLFYRHRPDYHSQGRQYTEASGILHPDDVAEQAAAGTFRIAVLGDSVAAATGLPFAERFVTLLERTLDENRVQGAVQALNFGVNGYSTLQEAALLDALVDRFTPDMLILQYCMNDFHPSDRPYEWFADHSPFYVIDYLASYIRQRNPLNYPDVDYWVELYRKDETGWQNVSEAFTHIARYAQERGIPVLLAVFPLLSREGWQAGEAAGRHERIVALGEQAGFHVIDLLPELARHDVDTLRVRPRDTFHFNAAGQRIVAEALAGWFRTNMTAWQAGP